MNKAIIPAAIATIGLCAAPQAPGTIRHVPQADARVPSLVGRWSRVHRCQELVNALKKAGLGATAPAAVGDFFPGSTPKQLAKKPDICKGAKPMVHSHFFAKDRRFAPWIRTATRSMTAGTASSAATRSASAAAPSATASPSVKGSR